MIVGLIGVKGSGKTYRQQELVKQGYVALDFKDALLDMASDLVGYDIRTNYDYFKENLLGLTKPQEPGPAFIQRYPAHKITAQVLAGYPEAMTGRVLLQRLGTEVMRKRDEDYWVNAWRRAAEDHLVHRRSIVVADCRFPNEMDAMRRLSKEYSSLVPGITVPLKFIFCDYRSPRYCATDPHESEQLAQHYLAQGYKDGDEIREGA
jgi:hypothetical protein